MSDNSEASIPTPPPTTGEVPSLTSLPPSGLSPTSLSLWCRFKFFTRHPRTLLFIFLILITTILFHTYYSTLSPPESPFERPIILRNETLFCYPFPNFCGTDDYHSGNRRVYERVDHHYSATSTVYCQPSIGGLLIHDSVSLPELDWLGVSRLKPENQSNDKAAEDKFCRKLRALGAQWWETYEEWTYADGDIFRFGNCYHLDARTLVAYPEDGGVWILRTDGRIPLHDLKYTDERWLPLSHTVTMQERVEVLQKIKGASFYRDTEGTGEGKAWPDGWWDIERWREDAYGRWGPEEVPDVVVWR